MHSIRSRAQFFPRIQIPKQLGIKPRALEFRLFNDMHGLIVGVGKQYCLKSKLQCEQCPLKPLLPASTTTVDL